MKIFDDIKEVNLGGQNYIEYNFIGLNVRINVLAFTYLKNAIVDFNSNKKEQALLLLNKAMEHSPENQNLYYIKGYIHEDLKQYNEALGCYDRSNRYSSNNQFWVDFRIALIFQNLNKFSSAIACYSKVVSEDFSDYTDPFFNYNLKKCAVFNNRAICYANIGDSPNCIKDCTSAIALNPLYHNSYLVRGLEYYKLDELGLAEKDLKEAKLLGNEKAEEFLKEFTPNTESVFERVKQYAESDIAIQKAGGRRLCELFRNDLIDRVNSFNPKTVYDLEQLSANYLVEMCDEFSKATGSIDDFYKSFLSYEITVAIKSIFKKTNLDFEDFYKNIIVIANNKL